MRPALGTINTNVGVSRETPSPQARDPAEKNDKRAKQTPTTAPRLKKKVCNKPSPDSLANQTTAGGTYRWHFEGFRAIRIENEDDAGFAVFLECLSNWLNL